MLTVQKHDSGRENVHFETHVVSTRIDGSSIGISTITIEGANDGPTLLINCGTHGDEPEGHSVLLDLVESIDPADLNGTIIGVTALNYPAYEHRKRGNPLDDWNYDMNRLFPGSATGTITQRLAHTICDKILPKADMLLDLHSGGNNIYVCERVIVQGQDEKNLRLAKAMGRGWSLIAVGAGERKSVAALTSYAAQLDIPALTVELGGSNNRLPENYARDVEMVYSAVLNVLRDYGMISGEPEYEPEWTFVEYEPLRNTYGGLVRYAPECRLKNRVAEGTLLMTIVDIFGNIVEEVRAPYDLVILSVPGQPFLPNGGAQIMTIGKITQTLR